MHETKRSKSLKQVKLPWDSCYNYRNKPTGNLTGTYTHDDVCLKVSLRNCENNVTNNDQAVQCDLSDSWIQIKCNGLNYTEYKFLENSNDPWFCISCFSKTFPFNTVKNNKNFISYFHDKNNQSGKTHYKDTDSSLLLKPSEHLKHLAAQFSNMSSSDDINNDDSENFVKSKY